MNIRSFSPGDFSAVTLIYQQGIETGQATFETIAPDWETWNKKFLPDFRFVAENENVVLGWAALSAISARAVYAGVCEVTIYIAPEAQGRGVGKMLLQNLIAASEANGIWTLQAGIFPVNKASVALHEKCGFRIVGFREKIGKMGVMWRDTLLLERRSKITGI
jgi:phosphinothricin acetyltransferase